MDLKSVYIFNITKIGVCYRTVLYQKCFLTLDKSVVFMDSNVFTGIMPVIHFPQY